MPSKFEKIKQKLAEQNSKRGQSPLEKWVIKFLEVAQIHDYELEYQVEWFFIDIAWPRLKYGVELDGWEFHKDKLERDKKRDDFLKSHGWKIYRIPSKSAWNPKLLAPYLFAIHKKVYGDKPIAYGLAELLNKKPEARFSERDEGNDFCQACGTMCFGKFCFVCKPLYA